MTKVISAQGIQSGGGAYAAAAGYYGHDSDPSSGAGLAAPIGSCCIYNGKLYIKRGSSDTGWFAPANKTLVGEATSLAAPPAYVSTAEVTGLDGDADKFYGFFFYFLTRSDIAISQRWTLEPNSQTANLRCRAQQNLSYTLRTDWTLGALTAAGVSTGWIWGQGYVAATRTIGGGTYRRMYMAHSQRYWSGASDVFQSGGKGVWENNANNLTTLRLSAAEAGMVAYLAVFKENNFAGLVT